MSDKEKIQKDIMKDIALLETGGLKVIQGNFNLTKLKSQWWRVNIGKLFQMRESKSNKVYLDKMNRCELKTYACMLNKWA